MLRRTALAAAAFAITAPLFAGMDGDRWLLLNGKQAGTVVVTTAPGSMTVEVADNTATSAEGSIGTKTLGGGNMIYVYHGDLLGKANPDPGDDGWGRVVKVPAGASITGDFATASQQVAEAVHLVTVGELGCNGGMALSLLLDSETTLVGLRAKVELSGLPEDMEAEHTKAIEALIAQIDAFELLLQELILAPNATLGQTLNATKKLKKIHDKIVKKQKALLDHLRDCGLIAE